MPRLDAAVARPDCEYLVVGSGAGGGTLAARLAEAGRRVILLEAGGDPRELSRRRSGAAGRQPPAARLRRPGLPRLRLREQRHRLELLRPPLRRRRDAAARSEVTVETHGGSRVDGVYYPRAGTLGGCTAHNAMIFVYPHNADWDDIARLTGDASWSSADDAELLRAHRELPAPPGPALAVEARPQPHAPRLARLAAARKR